MPAENSPQFAHFSSGGPVCNGALDFLYALERIERLAQKPESYFAILANSHLL